MIRRLLLLALLVALAACDDDSTGPGNVAPLVQVPEGVAGVVGETVRFRVSATDPDGDEVTLTVTPVLTITEFRQGIKTGAWTFDPETGEVAFTPNVNDVPERYFEASATDAQGHLTEELFPVSVTAPGSHP